MVGSLKRPHHFLLLSVALALFLRTYLLGTLPNGFHVDEMNAGYVGRYILANGKEIYGNPWPLFFNKLGDFRPTGIFYLSGLSTIFFGNNEAAVRFPSALFGALTVVALFLLTRELFGDTTSALLSSLFLAVLPWHIVLSRATSEAIIGLFFVCLGLWKLLSGLRESDTSSVRTAALLLFVSYFFYHAFRFLVPLLLIPCLWYPSRERRVAKSIVGIVALFWVLTLAISVAPWGGSRFKQVAFYKNPTLPNTIESLIFADGTNNVLTARTFHNKPVIYTREFMKQYSRYLSPDFLFLTGGLPYRYAVPEQGLLYVVFTPFILLGLIYLLRTNAHAWRRGYVLYMLLIAAVPAALTYEDAPNIHRSVFLVVPLTTLAAYGATSLRVALSSRTKLRLILTSLAALVLLAEIFYFSHQYALHAPSYKSVLRNDTSRELILSVLEKKQSFAKVVMTIYDELPLYYLFYAGRFTNVPDEVFVRNGTSATIDTAQFIDTWCPSKRLREKGVDMKNTLIIDQADCEEVEGLVELARITRRDSTGAYKILTTR